MLEREKETIVVVDDDDGLRQAFERLLNAAGFQALTFPSAETLLQADAAGSAACLVLDIHLPGLSGFDLRRELVRTAARQPPVIFITGHDEPAARDQAEALGAFAYLPKPFAGRTLVDAVARALGEARLM
jgi:FixJ family two-component response regulator